MSGEQHSVIRGLEDLLYCPTSGATEPVLPGAVLGFLGCAGCGEELSGYHVSEGTALRPPSATGAAAVTK